MRVGAWMMSKVITIKPDASLRDAEKLMEGCHVRHLPVVQGGRLVGLVTDRDLNAAYPSPATSLSIAEIQAAWGQIPVAAVMRRQVIAVAPRTPLAEAARLMLSRLLSVAVISPLLVGIVIRTYGWTVLLSRQGLVNQLLHALGLIEAPLRLMGNNVGVIISLLHVFYPFMVIPLATTLQKIERPLEEAAMVLGANRWQVFWRVFVPLSIPGMLAGSVLVFLLTASSFVTTRLIGQNLTKWFFNLLEEQALIVFDWPFGAALATIFVAILALLITAHHRLLASRFAFIRKGNSS